MKIVDASKNVEWIQTFLSRAKSSLQSFRYFDSRSFDVIENHVSTLLIFEKAVPVCYGHLDFDGSKVWLGIAVAQMDRGKGYGNIMMNELIDQAKKKGIPTIYLSVDTENSIAKSLYEKKGFYVDEEKDGKTFMKLNLS